jgi:ATP-binding cassette subfamily C protein
MKLLIDFARAQPWRCSLTLLCLTLAALAEGVGFSSMLPLLGLAERAGSGGTGAGSEFEQVVNDSLRRVGIEPTMPALLALIMAVMTLRSLLLLLANRQVGYTVAQVATDLRLRLLRALLATRWAYFTRQPVGTFSNAFATEATRTSQAFLGGVTMVSQALQLLIYTAVAAATSWKVTVVAIPLGFLTTAALTWLVFVTRAAGRKQTRLLKEMLAHLTDVFDGVKTLKVMACEGLISPLLEGGTQRLNKTLRRQVLAKEAMVALQELVLMAFVVIGVYLTVTRLKMELSVIFMLMLLFVRALTSLNKAQRQYQTLAADESAYWSMLHTIEEAEAEGEAWPGTRAPRLASAIEMREVTFCYGSKTVFDRISLLIPAAQITVLIGPSGSGKTTLVDLLTGLARPDSGSILIDGLPFATLDLRAWRRMIGYVAQETFLLHESVERNVSLGDPQVTRDDVERALRLSGAWPFVSRLAEGVETFVGEHGLQLSGGERQRIAIARALVRRPRLLILDEATAALDAATEASVWETVAGLRREATILVVAHQPGVLHIADRIYRIDAGRAEAVLPPAASATAR